MKEIIAGLGAGYTVDMENTENPIVEIMVNVPPCDGGKPSIVIEGTEDQLLKIARYLEDMPPHILRSEESDITCQQQWEALNRRWEKSPGTSLARPSGIDFEPFPLQYLPFNPDRL